MQESKVEYKESDGDERRYKPPCRRTCSTIHNPVFHFPRVTKIRGVRPKSAELKDEAKQEPHEINWTDTLLHELIDAIEVLPSIL